jgi:hypothetical protein
MWYQNNGGPGRNNRTAILGKGLEYQQFALSQRDMQYAEQKANNIEDILAAFRLNKIAVGKYEDINFATIKEGRKMLWKDTYQPIDELITSSISNQWTRHLKNKLTLRSDYADIPELREDYKDRGASAKVMYDMGYPASLAAKINNIPLTKEDITKYPWLDEKPTTTTPNQQQDPLKAIKKAIKSKDEKGIKKAKAKFYEHFIKTVIDPGEKEWIRALNRFFHRQISLMKDKVDSWTRTQKALEKITIVNASMFLLDAEEENIKLAQVFKPLVKDQLLRDEAKLTRELGQLVEWGVDDETISDFAQARGVEIQSINKTTFDGVKRRVGEAITIGISQNETVKELAKRIKTALTDTEEWRKGHSETIARTETGIVSSTARFTAFHSEGFEYTEWVTASDNDVRATHLEAAAAGPVKIGEKFPGTNMRYPLDPMGDVGEIVNCRCVSVASEGPNEEPIIPVREP